MVLALVLSDDPGDSFHRWPSKGHLRSPKVNNRFLLITFDPKEIETSEWSQFVFSHQDASIHMQYELLGSPRDLDMRSNFDLDLSRSWYTYSMRLDEANTMVSKSLLYHFKHGSNRRKTVSLKNAVFDLSWPLTQARNHESEVTGDHMECGPQKPPG